MDVSTHSRNAIFFMFFLATLTTLTVGQGTRVGFYSTSCPRAETIVRSVVQSAFNSDSTVAPGLLRVHFHDCFVRGCDGSILIDGANTEKTAGPNLLLRGFNVIDAAKTQLEAACPGVVSCADIVALAARDSVVLTRGLTWQVPTGRRDGLISQASDTSTLPGFNEPISALINKFSGLGLNTQDLVALSGGHTIGTASCGTFSYRLYNYNSTNAPDPTINTSFLPQLQTSCPNGGSSSTRVGLDTGSVNNFDTSYFTNLQNGRGVLESDQGLWTDSRTRPIVQRLMSTATFGVQFGRSMVKMGNIGVLTGTQGEIRRVCTATN